MNSLFIPGGALGAIVIIVGAFLKHLRSERKDQNEERKAQRGERSAFLDLITNHLRHNTEAMTHLKASHEGLNNTLQMMLRHFQKNS